jgi:ABC-2 type transport system permease protein
LAISQGASVWSGLEDISIPTSLVVAGPVYLVLGYLLFGALLAGIGASVTSMQEGQQIASIASLIAVIPMMLSVTFFENANGPLPTAMSLIPFTATIAMVMRLPFADVPVWQIGLSILLLTLTTLLTVWIAARIFRIGLLMYGKRLDSRSLWIALHQSLDRDPASEKDAVL